jgi:hypothetical protein
MRGSPSPWKVFAIMAKDASVRDSRLRVSVKERAEGVDGIIDVFRTTIAVVVMVTVMVTIWRDQDQEVE